MSPEISGINTSNIKLCSKPSDLNASQTADVLKVGESTDNSEQMDDIHI